MKSRQHGLSLIDVMVAVLLFSIGVLGLVALQATATQNSANAESEAIAAVLADEMVTAFYNGNGVVPSGTTYTNWTTRVTGTSALPNACAYVSGTSGNSVTVTIWWQAPSGTGTVAAPTTQCTSASGLGNQYVTTSYWP